MYSSDRVASIIIWYCRRRRRKRPICNQRFATRILYYTKDYVDEAYRKSSASSRANSRSSRFAIRNRWFSFFSITLLFISLIIKLLDVCSFLTILTVFPTCNLLSFKTDFSLKYYINSDNVKTMQLKYRLFFILALARSPPRVLDSTTTRGLLHPRQCQCTRYTSVEAPPRNRVLIPFVWQTPVFLLKARR